MGTNKISSHLFSRPARVLNILLFLIGIVLAGCTKVPEGVQPVSGFDLQRFLGTWYEVARLDHGFERNLQNVTAEYVAGENGEIKVINRGFNEKTGQWVEDDAVAKMVGDSDVGSLKVSFFGPLWGGYHVIALDAENYRYAMVTGPSKSLLWILSRDKTLDDKTLGQLVNQATKWGYDTKKLIYVKHEEPQQKPVAQPSPAASAAPESSR